MATKLTKKQKGFRWTGWIKPTNQSAPMQTILSANFAIDKYGKPIVRSEEEMDNIEE